MGGKKKQGLATAPLVSWKAWVTSYLIKLDCRCLGVTRKMRGKELSFMRWREDLEGSGTLDRSHQFCSLGCRKQKCNLDLHNGRRDKLVKRKKNLMTKLKGRSPWNRHPLFSHWRRVSPQETGSLTASQVLQLGYKWTSKVLLIL